MWTLLYNSIEKPAKDWGISDIQLHRVNQAADELTIVFDGKNVDAPEPFPYGASITVYADRTQTKQGDFFHYSDGAIYFTGQVITNPGSASGPAESQRIVVQGPWKKLEDRIYHQRWKQLINLQHPEQGVEGDPRTHLILNQGDNGARLTTAQQMTDAAAWLLESAQLAAEPAPLQIDSTLPAVQVPFDEVRDISCAEVFHKQLRWLVDAVTHFDYAISPPKLYVTPRPLMTAVDVALTECSQFEITPRHDLLRSAVFLKFEQINEVNGQQYLSTAIQKAPSNATGREDKAFASTIQLQGSSLNIVAAQVVAETIQAAASNDAVRLAWWKAHLPWLAGDRIDELSIAANSVIRESDRPRKLVHGQIAPWMGVACEEETILGVASYKILDADGNITGDRFEEQIPVRLNTTTAVTGTYRTIESGSEGEAIPSGLAAAIYAAVSQLQYEGQITIEEEEVSQRFRLGQVINITGGKSEWATMRAVIQSVTEDLFNGRTTIQFGPATHLGVDDLIELYRVNRYRWNFTNPATRTTGQGAANSVTLGKQTAKENSNAGAGNYRQLVIANGDVSLDLNALGKYLLMVGGEGEGSVKMELTSDHPELPGTAGKEMAIREWQISTLENGNCVTKKIRLLSSTLYTTPP